MRSFIVVSLAVILSSICLASEEIPVNVKAEKLIYIEGSSIIEAVGSVEVKMQGVTIYADRLLMDSETNIATAEGHVRLVGDEYQALADFMVYHSSSEVTEFKGFRSRLSSGQIKGEMYVSAKEITDQPDKKFGSLAGLSTCDEENVHFFLLADRVEIYPGDKVLGYNATLYVGVAPVFWTPIIYYDLASRGNNNFVYGHNDVEGDYLKSAWVYPLGILYLDLMEKKGFGKGTKTNYGLGGLGGGELFLYHLDEKDTKITDWVTKINHTKKINDTTTLKLDQALTATYLIPSGRRDQTSLDLDLDHRSAARWNLHLNNFDDRLGYLRKYALSFRQSYKKTSSDYYANYNLSKKDPKWISASQRFSYRRPLWSDNVMLSTKANYYNYVTAEGNPGDERLEPVIDLTGREKGYSWRVTRNWYIDLDKDAFFGDENYQYLEKQPEVEVSLDPIKTQVVNLRPKFGYGYYREVRYVSQLGRNRDFATSRYQSTLDVDREFPLGRTTILRLGAGLDQFLYGPGDQLYAYRESLTLNTDAWGFYQNRLDYRKGSTDGNTPFLFDRLGTVYHNVRDTMTFYYRDKVNLAVDGGHNWQTHKWFDVNGNLKIKPDEHLVWNLRTGWDIENTQYKDLINTLSVLPYSFFNLNFSTVSDMNLGKLKSGSILYDIYFLEGQANQWHIKLGQIYETASDSFKMRDIMIVKDLHCMELTYTYSDLRKEFSLTFSLKAIPDEPIGMSTGRGFYMDSFEQSLKDVKKEGAVERY